MKQAFQAIAFLFAFSSPILLRGQEKVLTQPEALTTLAVQELKRKIIDMTRRNTEQTAKATSIRHKLDPFISALVATAPASTEMEKLPLVVGAWQEIWTDAAAQIYVGPAPGSYDLSQIYQAVTPNGYYYSIGRYRRPGLEDLTVFLRGEYSLQSYALQVKFTKYVFGVGWLYEGSNLLEQTFRAETGVFDGQTFEPPSSFNPVGLPQPALSNLSVDNDFRILQAGEGSSMFILVRVGSHR